MSGNYYSYPLPTLGPRPGVGLAGHALGQEGMACRHCGIAYDEWTPQQPCTGHVAFKLVRRTIALDAQQLVMRGVFPPEKARALRSGFEAARRLLGDEVVRSQQAFLEAIRAVHRERLGWAVRR